MRDQLGKWPVLLLFLVVCLLISIPAVSVWYSGTKGAIVSRVKNGEARLTEVASSIIERGSAGGVSVSGVQEIVYHSDSKTVGFLYGGFGLAPSSSYTGFYHSSPNIPLGFQGEVMSLIKTDTRWSYERVNEDNRYETKKIVDRWYYLHMSF